MASSASKEPNRLAKEKSPYLLQHQYNPVDWYPWGEEAIQKARTENKPIFLSVGYSTCHWCHVMEHTTFEVQEAADVMNKYFVNIKVDREERPDVDKVYMNYILLTTGHGGWPMSVFLEPKSLAPIYGGTYYSAHGEGRRPGFVKICETIASQWETNREKIIKSGETIAGHLKARAEDALANASEREAFLAALDEPIMIGAAQRARSFDPAFGGWGPQPKFPQPVILTAMFVAHFLRGDSKTNYLDQCEKTLTQMFYGGIHDHLGGGFHRYSVTEEWKLPHFEKMLYDQSQIATGYITAYQLTKKDIYKSAAMDIFKYIDAQLTDRESGGFYSAEDADSPLPENPSVKREGAFYVWAWTAIESLVSDKEFLVLTHRYGLREDGNVNSEYDPHGEMTGMNILHTEKNFDQISFSTSIAVNDIQALLTSAEAKLAEAQSKRPRPHLDDKCVTVWNAMMISALSKGYQAFHSQKYLDMALRSLQFIRANLYQPSSKRLLRTFRAGPSSIEAFAEDYANLIAALIDLYEATFDHTHLQWALELQQTMDDLFWDSQDGGYFCDSGNPDLHLLVRTKDDYDGSEPSYNSVAAYSLVRLYNIFYNDQFKKRAEDLFSAFSGHITKMPVGLPMMTVAAAALARPPHSVIIYGDLSAPTTQCLLRTVQSEYDPFRVVIQASFGSEAARFFHDQGVDFFKSLDTDMSVDGKPAVYICKDFTCGIPITDEQNLAKAISKRQE
jgi:hypothetical protein